MGSVLILAGAEPFAFDVDRKVTTVAVRRGIEYLFIQSGIKVFDFSVDGTTFGPLSFPLSLVCPLVEHAIGAIVVIDRSKHPDIEIGIGVFDTVCL